MMTYEWTECCDDGFASFKIMMLFNGTECPKSSDPPEKTFNRFASENEVYTIY